MKATNPRLVFLLLLGLVLLVGLLGTAAADDHGDSPLVATPIPTDGTLIQGCIERPGDLDYFLFSGLAGRRYLIQTSHLTPEMDTLVYLFGTDGQTILAVDDNSGGGRASRLEWNCPASGTYFVMVRHAQATAGTGCYALSISLTQADDHGNDPLSATPISADGKPIPGYIEVPGDVDYFLFTAEANWNYIIRTDRLTPEMDTVLTLYGPDGRTVLAEDDNSGGGKASRLYWPAPASGTYFLAVRHASPSGTGGYELVLERSGYGDDYGNDPASAAAIPTDGAPVRGRIEVPGDIDYFSFSAKAEGEYTISTSGLSPEMDTVLTLYGPDGRTVLAEDDNSGGGRASKLVWTCPASGTYYLSVRHARADGTGSYMLTIGALLKLREVGSLKPPGYALDVWVEGRFAYLVVGFFGLLVLDISEPARPVQVGSYSTRDYARSITLSGGYAYRADRGGGLVILDISDPMRPEEVATFDTPGSAQEVALSGSYAYVADSQGGLQIVDISNPRSPKGVGSYATRGYAEGVYVSGHYAYLATGDAGLEIVDISEPRNPKGVSALDLPGEAHSVWVSGDYAYVASGYRGLQIVDVSDPANPRISGSQNTEGEAFGLFLAGSYLYLADYTAGLLLLSLADPKAPQPVAKLDTPGSAMSVFVSGDYAYVADREGGLRIIQLI
ncbi:MAG: DVUA0089 family protein [Candidatus Bipolaricaulia bacterium]